jgi:hypothetical protein
MAKSNGSIIPCLVVENLKTTFETTNQMQMFCAERSCFLSQVSVEYATYAELLVENVEVFELFPETLSGITKALGSWCA